MILEYIIKIINQSRLDFPKVFISVDGGLARELSKNFMIKIFADHIENHKDFDEQASFSIERVGGPKLLRKYRKAYLIDEFVKESKVKGIIADH